MVDVLSHGRLDFGVGRGYQPHEYEMLGLADKTGREPRDLPGVARRHHRALDPRALLLQGQVLRHPGRRASSPAVPAAPSADLRRGDQPRDLLARGRARLQHPRHADARWRSRSSSSSCWTPSAAWSSTAGIRETIEFPMNWQMHLAPTRKQASENTRRRVRLVLREGHGARAARRQGAARRTRRTPRWRAPTRRRAGSRSSNCRRWASSSRARRATPSSASARSATTAASTASAAGCASAASSIAR